MDPLNLLEEKKKLQAYITTEGKTMKKSFGHHTDIISADESIRYLIELIKEKKIENPTQTYAMTSSITVVAFETWNDSIESSTPLDSKNILSVESVSSKIAKTYNNLLTKYRNLNGIYTVLNSSNCIDSTSRYYASHQNWLYLNVNTGELLRFEPSHDYEEFQTDRLCRLITEKLSKLTGTGYRYSLVSGEGLNTFNGCRAVSTMMAGMYIKGIDMKQIENVRGKYIKPFIYLMQLSIRKRLGCADIISIQAKRGRRAKTYGSVVF